MESNQNLVSAQEFNQFRSDTLDQFRRIELILLRLDRRMNTLDTHMSIFGRRLTRLEDSSFSNFTNLNNDVRILKMQTKLKSSLEPCQNQSISRHNQRQQPELNLAQACSKASTGGSFDSLTQKITVMQEKSRRKGESMNERIGSIFNRI